MDNIQTLHDSSKYKTFISDRNKALERININAQVDNSLYLHSALEAITGSVSYIGIQEQMTLSQMRVATQMLDVRIDQIFDLLRVQIVGRVTRMRKTTFILTYLSELEAIARATQRQKIIDPSQFKQKLAQQTFVDTLQGKSLDKQVWFGLSKLKDKIIQAFQRGILMEESPKAVVDRVKDAYPKLVEYKRPPRVLKPLREADKKKDDEEPEGKEFDFYHDLVTDEDWEQTLQAHQDTEMDMESRGSQQIFTDDSGIRKYEWEIEQDTTDDFVQQVRQGQVAAANDLGVKDFVWVAIIDKKTCEVCCIPRAGKTTSEIEAMLASGELDKNECDAIVPPAHPFCRCDIAPVASTDPVEGPDWKSFDNWLDS